MAGSSSALALNRDGAARYLPWTIGLKMFFAALAVSGTVVLERVATTWQSGAYAVVTVELPADATSEMREAALGSMRRTVGVTSAELISDDEVAELLRPWLGANEVPPDLPLPVLIDVRIDEGEVVDWSDAEARLHAAVPEASLETGAVWVERLVDFARLGQLLAAVVLLVVSGVAVLTVVFATRAGLAIHRETVELLHLLGASDAYLAREFQWQAFWLGLRGGIGGVVCAGVALVAVGLAAGRMEAPLLPDVGLGIIGWILLILLPLLSGLMTMIAARQTVLYDLARVP
jgi:cell division transport system permease protein